MSLSALWDNGGGTTLFVTCSLHFFGYSSEALVTQTAVLCDTDVSVVVGKVVFLSGSL